MVHRGSPGANQPQSSQVVLPVGCQHSGCFVWSLQSLLAAHTGAGTPRSNTVFGSENVLLIHARTQLCKGFQHHAPFHNQVVDACCWTRARKLINLREPQGSGFRARDSHLMARDILRSTVGRLTRSQLRTRCCQLCDSHPTGRRNILMKFGYPQQHGIIATTNFPQRKEVNRMWHRRRN